MTIYLSLLFALIGALVYVFVAHPKAQELGRLTYASGLLAFLLVSVREVVARLS